MGPKLRVNRALSAIEDAIVKLRRVRSQVEGPRDVDRALRELDDAESDLRRAMREMPDV